jgi:hypothetical protein
MKKKRIGMTSFLEVPGTSRKAYINIRSLFPSDRGGPSLRSKPFQHSCLFLWSFLARYKPQTELNAFHHKHTTYIFKPSLNHHKPSTWLPSRPSSSPSCSPPLRPWPTPCLRTRSRLPRSPSNVSNTHLLHGRLFPIILSLSITFQSIHVLSPFPPYPVTPQNFHPAA